MSSENVGSSRTSRDNRRPRWAYLLLACLVFLGSGAIYGGVSFILDPTGGILGIPSEWIQDSPFGSYLIPGVFLLIVLGFGSFVTAFGIARCRLWAWPFGLALGIITVLWIVIQYGVIQQYFFLQPVIAGVGTAIIALLLIPSMRRYYRANAALSRFGVIRRQ